MFGPCKFDGKFKENKIKMKNERIENWWKKNLKLMNYLYAIFEPLSLKVK